MTLFSDLGSVGKLSVDAAEELRPVPVAGIRAYSLTWVPHYLFLEKNQKFIPMRRPFDFFSGRDMEKLKSVESLWVPMERSPYERQLASGLRIREYLDSLTAKALEQANKGDFAELTVSTFEISSQMIRMMPSIWGSGARIEHTEMAAWADGFCDPVPGEILEPARDRGEKEFRDLLVLSGWAVFLSLHLGHSAPDYLTQVRNMIVADIQWGLGETDDLIESIRGWIKASPRALTVGQLMEDWNSPISQKLSFRLERVLESVRRMRSGLEGNG